MGAKAKTRAAEVEASGGPTSLNTRVVFSEFVGCFGLFGQTVIGRTFF